MSTFSGYHISQFNQKAKHLVGDGKAIMTYKEMRDLQSEMLELLIILRKYETVISELKEQLSNSDIVEVELIGESFKK
jgi:spore maturation protein CgeB